MKPISLEIMGLNSFRDPQVIEFERLSETGVFGIFGPTGSGKSTILDALTLALYGTVERASNNTQGILNHAAQQLGVKFTFSLGTGEKKKIFRAERSYRRSGERSVNASVCRLIQLGINDGEDAVLASKDKEMTKKIEEILGLNSVDFTRAVVLPQGKFAEFLTIKPKERREMLERLFALEAYGKELAAKLSERSRSADFALHGVEQKLQGLGDASSERLRQAEQESNEASVSAAAATQQLEITRKAYDTAREIWNLQEELSRLKGREQELETRRVSLATIRERLELAERAEKVRPLLTVLSLAEENLRRTESKTADLESKRVQARLAEEAAASAWKSANQIRLKEEPQILRRIERLEQARMWEEEIKGRNSALQEMRREFARAAKAKDAAAEELKQAAERLEAAQLSLRTFKARLGEITIDPVERSKVNAAVEALKTYQMFRLQAESLEKDYRKNQAEEQTCAAQWEKKRGLLQRAQEEVANLKRNAQENKLDVPGNEEELSRRVQESEKFRAMLANIERLENEGFLDKERSEKEALEFSRVQAEMVSVEQELEEQSRQRDEAAGMREVLAAQLKGLEIQNLAGVLAIDLKDNEPCPVCGSRHHPLPGLVPGNEHFARTKAALEEAKLLFEKLDQTVRELNTKRAVFETRLSHMREQLSGRKAQLEEKEKEIAGLREQIPQEIVHRDMPLAQLQAKLAELDLNIALEREAYSRWRETGEEINKKLEQVEAALSGLGEESSQLQARHAGTLRVGEELANRLVLLRAELSRKQAELDKACREIGRNINLNNNIPADSGHYIGSEGIIPLQKKYAEWDLEAARLNKEIAQVEENVRVLQGKERRFLEEKTAQELVLRDLEATGREARQALESTQAKLTEITGGKPSVQFLLAEEENLAQVKQAEEESKKSYEEAQKVLNHVEQDFAVLTKELEIHRSGVEEAREKLSRGLLEAQLVTVAAAESSLLDENERLKLAEDIKRFQQDEVLLKDQKREVLIKLKGRSLNPEDWLAWPVRLKQAEQSQNQALERRGAAQAAIIELAEKHKEWKELDGQRKSLSHRLGLIKTLQGVLKGNSFVEFIAEEQLISVAIEASERLAQLTNYRYALEVDSEGGFIIRDDANGGFRRPVGSLSGGETFLTSLALALSLSSQIQLRGEAPLEFFFLDEGFGTLDTGLLETVMGTLEKLHLQNLIIGIISHVPELRNRLARRLIVTPAEPGGEGSKVKLEMA